MCQQILIVQEVRLRHPAIYNYDLIMDLMAPLKQLVSKVSRSIGAVLIDNEGEAITFFSVDGKEGDERVRLIAAYHRIWLSDCVKLTKHMQLGEMQHLIQRYESGTVIVKALKNNHALILIGESGMYLGQGILHLETVGEKINEDL